jgi:hypothetical protein
MMTLLMIWPPELQPLPHHEPLSLGEGEESVGHEDLEGGLSGGGRVSAGGGAGHAAHLLLDQVHV